MRSWEVPWRGNTLEIDTGQFGDLVETLSRPEFGAALLKLLTSRVPLAFLNVVSMEHENVIRGHWIELGPGLDAQRIKELTVQYRKKYLHSDPLTRTVLNFWARPANLDPQIILHQMAAASIRNREWRENSYYQADLCDRFVMGAGHPHSGWVFLVLLRKQEQGLFLDEELAWLAQIAPLVMRLVMRHENINLRPDPPSTNLSISERRLLQVRSDLTTRETEVCTRILQGKSLAEIGQELNIGVNSVKTYRSRAFQRLGISSRFELLSIILG